MEITTQARPVIPTIRPSISVAGNEAPLFADDVKSASASAKPPSARVLDALHRLAHIRGERLSQHAKAVAAFSTSSGFGSNSTRATGLNNDALQDAFAGVKLGSILDLPKEQVAMRDLQRSSEDLFKQSACGAMPCDDPKMVSLLSSVLEEDVGGENLADIWNELADKIEQFQNGALDAFSRAAEQTKALFEELTKAVADMEKWMTQDGDNKINFDSKKLESALSEVRKNFPPQSFSKNTIGGGFDTKGEAAKLCDLLQMDPEKCINFDSETGKWFVSIDMSVLVKMLQTLPKNGEMSVAAFNAWKQGFDAQFRLIENATQERGQKYSNSYSRFESFHKTVLSIIQAFTDMMKSFFPF